MSSQTTYRASDGVVIEQAGSVSDEQDAMQATAGAANLGARPHILSRGSQQVLGNPLKLLYNMDSEVVIGRIPLPNSGCAVPEIICDDAGKPTPNGAALIPRRHAKLRSDRGRENYVLTAFDYTFLNDELLPAGKLKPVSRILRRGDRFTLDVAIIV